MSVAGGAGVSAGSGRGLVVGAGVSDTAAEGAAAGSGRGVLSFVMTDVFSVVKSDVAKLGAARGAKGAIMSRSDRR